MKLKLVLGTTTATPHYYKFIPSQIQAWKYFGIDFLAVFIGETLPNELQPYKSNIFLWNNTLALHSVYVAQLLRLFFPALLCMNSDECVMITDMDMLPARPAYFKDGLDLFPDDAFIHYRAPENDQFYMCYNAAHPSTWSKLFNVKSIDDIKHHLIEHYPQSYGVKGLKSWFTDQCVLYKLVHKYEKLQILKRPITRLEVCDYKRHLEKGETNFVSKYDDIHFHQTYIGNEDLIRHALTEIILYQPASSRE